MALIANNAVLNEETDPYQTIARLQREITRLRAELAIARGEGEDTSEELPDYEKERCVQLIKKTKLEYLIFIIQL